MYLVFFKLLIITGTTIICIIIPGNDEIIAEIDNTSLGKSKRGAMTSIDKIKATLSANIPLNIDKNIPLFNVLNKIDVTIASADISIAIINAIGGMIGGIPVIKAERNGVTIAIRTDIQSSSTKAAIKTGKNIGKKEGPSPNW